MVFYFKSMMVGLKKDGLTISKKKYDWVKLNKSSYLVILLFK